MEQLLTKKQIANHLRELLFGRKDKYGEPTIIVTSRIPQSKKKAFKEKVAVILKKWEKKQ